MSEVVTWAADAGQQAAVGGQRLAGQSGEGRCSRRELRRFGGKMRRERRRSPLTGETHHISEEFRPESKEPWARNAVTPAGHGGVEVLLRGDAPPGSALLVLHLGRKGALGLAPLGPPVLEPDLERRHARQEPSQTQNWIGSHEGIEKHGGRKV